MLSLSQPPLVNLSVIEGAVRRYGRQCSALINGLAEAAVVSPSLAWERYDFSLQRPPEPELRVFRAGASGQRSEIGDHLHDVLKAPLAHLICIVPALGDASQVIFRRERVPQCFRNNVDPSLAMLRD